MAGETNNYVTTEDVPFALDVEMNQRFMHEYEMLADILDIFDPEIVAAGTARYQYKVTGKLEDGDVAEGEEVPASHYELKKIPVGEFGIKKYRKVTTAESIIKSGYKNSIMRTDKKMLSDVRSVCVSDFFDGLGKGTGEAAGDNLQQALAQGDAELNVTLEENKDQTDRIIHFVNTYDIADYLGNANIEQQTMFGMKYIKSFLGVNDIFVTAKVPEGVVWVTPIENIHIYGIDFGTLQEAGFDYTVTPKSLIGVHHEIDYGKVSAETHAVVGMEMLAEILDFIVKVTIGEAGSDEPAAAEFDPEGDTPPTSKQTNAQIQAWAQAHDIDLGTATTKDAMLAAIAAALDGGDE